MNAILYLTTLVLSMLGASIATLYAPRIIAQYRRLKTRKKGLNQRIVCLEEEVERMGNIVHNRERNQRDKIRKEVNLYLEELKND